MAKFVFRLQSVLNLKARLEEQQRLSFAAARKRLDEEEEKLQALYVRLEGYEDEARNMRHNALVVRDILETETSIIRVKEYIDEQKAQVRLREMQLEEEREKLVVTMQERQMYEKLREKAFDEFVSEQNHAEGVENDEHNSYVYGQKTNEA
ncbi:MAG: flagellar export protein FliJ [Lachnospiraceae bacterium]|nr:flagellar export protein FliJ [Lachnospiraceae bacterium]